ncbi:putative spermidine/putrescine transport system permease protein [Kineococcus xinjiangensis]|uniref:Putative spermidine/putrescine transport system permease protein n=1 Tax=Kineococcus xinjiangensis TaxID=512762 RepID=A0A2S6IXA0_9ACTN|nr:ABC transporter permease subunit [Kineococcus xinjiangensis]PPK98860.1 putative spermidine/putrescine transport system permease protein [Kineococcus xinjiangensis]
MTSSRATGSRLSWIGAVPFLGYVALFLLLPTSLVVVQSFADAQNRPTLANVRFLAEPYVVSAFGNSIALSAVSAVIGAVLGAVLAWVVATGHPDGTLRRIATAVCGVLAQFGGVTLAFAFIATVGTQGLLTLLLQDLGLDLAGPWLYRLPGLVLVYSYFQIPLMVLVFLPALDGVRPQWREAVETLGGSTWQYLRHVAVPLLTPAFLGALLLLFANAFAAYATAAALISQGGVIVPLQIRTALTSEVLLGRENVGKALALGMVLVVAVAMYLYARVQARGARWLR